MQEVGKIKLEMRHFQDRMIDANDETCLLKFKIICVAFVMIIVKGDNSLKKNFESSV